MFSTYNDMSLRKVDSDDGSDGHDNDGEMTGDGV
jgi:hypothetical protein